VVCEGFHEIVRGEGSAESFEFRQNYMTFAASLVICTHNPRLDYMDRVLAALKEQTLPFRQWELLVIDNASPQPLADLIDLTWHPNSRCIVEEELGLTPARLRGIKDSCGDLIVFVDDDNVLAADYLESAVEIANAHRYIGAFGGSTRGEFEIAPEPWIRPYLNLLAIREVQRDSWSNLHNSWNESTPLGAGLCVRRSVAQDYLDKTLGNSKRRALGRVGSGTGSYEDTDLAYCAIDLGMGIGTFSRLQLIHLIPAKRLQVEYIARLSAGIHASNAVLKSLRPSTHPAARTVRLSGVRFYLKYWIRLATTSRIDRKIAIAVHSGQQSGLRFLKESSGEGALIQY
jgi:glycosyltransferase involved in cell wall biosynthesis